MWPPELARYFCVLPFAYQLRILDTAAFSQEYAFLPGIQRIIGGGEGGGKLMGGTPINWQLSCPRQWRKLSRPAGDSDTHSKRRVTGCVSSIEINSIGGKLIGNGACRDCVNRDCLGRELTYRSRQSCNFRITRGPRIRENFVPWRRNCVQSNFRRTEENRRWRGTIVQFSVGGDDIEILVVCVSNFGLWLFRYRGWYVDSMWMVYWLCE